MDWPRWKSVVTRRKTVLTFSLSLKTELASLGSPYRLPSRPLIETKVRACLAYHTLEVLIMKFVAAIAVFVALGAILPISHSTAFVIPFLGSFGAFSVRAVIALLTFGYMHHRYG